MKMASPISMLLVGTRTSQDYSETEPHLPDTKELARHGDIRMTMRYTHISLDDQAKALQSLPAPCQPIVSESTGSSSPKLATDDHESPDEERETEDKNPCNCRGSVI